MQENKKLLYIANIRFPTEKAHGVQIAKTCEALAKKNALEALVVTDRKTPITEDAFAYYGISTPFRVLHARSLDLVSLGFIGFLIQTFSFIGSTRAVIRRFPDAILYGRDEIVLWGITRFTRRSYTWESHTGSWNFFARSLCKGAQTVVVISKGLKEFYCARGVPGEKIQVIPDAIDTTDFVHPQSKQEARARLGLPKGFVALYVGRLDGWKGAGTILKTSTIVDSVITIAVIGGDENQIEKFKREYPNVLFLGYRPYKELANNLSAADVLLLPTSGKDIVGARFTSPLKLFAYLASGKPIIATDVPSHREILPEGSAYFVPADDEYALACTLKTLKDEPAMLESMAKISKALSAKYTWNARAESIASLI